MSGNIAGLSLPITIAIITAGAYLIGSIPFGLVIARLFGLGNLRQIGSGNIGATNVLRTGNKLAALLTLICDSGKGLIIIIALTYMMASEIMLAAAAVASITGHCYPLWLRFQGGKGVATGLGVFLGLDFMAGVLICLTWLIVALIFRWSSLSAIVSYLSAPLLIALSAFWRGEEMPLALIYGVGIMAALATWRHRSNITRLIAGKEPKIGRS
ncbi:MAG: acyl-phosphate glycerol 3-phosphate acyltransferase [Candidatus Puniceispirillum sp. TMED52]|nr:acyl-phosphate glycerol 3-phosphate acyltransferase [SAR116 cluster bacterium]OUU54170.1 MAG: acyl-phosphate glycerol 3-phosphate acyltransferase [Candidatus Puniceispirillum sp. TMED52]